MARPTITITKAMIKKCEKLAGQGLTLEQIAHCIGISYSCLNQKKKLLKQLNESIKKGQASAIGKVTNKLFINAMKGDNTAIIFFLKNRDRKSWGDNPEEQRESKPITINIVNPHE